MIVSKWYVLKYQVYLLYEIWIRDCKHAFMFHVGHICQQPHILIIKNLQIIDHLKFPHFFSFLMYHNFMTLTDDLIVLNTDGRF